MGKDLLPFLRTQLAANSQRNDLFSTLGKYTLSFIDEVKSALPYRRIFDNGEPDLEFILSLADRINENQYDEEAGFGTLLNDLDATNKSLDLSPWDLAKVGLDFRMLVADAFQSKSLRFLNRRFRSKEEDLVAPSDAWTDLVSPGDILITFNWDLVSEVLLCRANKWSYRDGYGIRIALSGLSGESPVKILKLHGSCNWALRDPEDPSLYIH
ncbi:MAG TPA: hypothetical protein VEI04_00575 [Syntrophobacteria bacterium]|nr:hypothetical protein [Syntrophobacteria bacterium]